MTDLTLEDDTETPERDELTADIFGAPASAPAATIAEPPAAYTVIARKYRPRNFDDLIGQEGMVRTLKNAFSSGRIAHAFMLTGVRGVGKTTTARLLARALNYESDTVHQPSVVDLGVEGRHCKAIIDGRHLDVLELDAASRTSVSDMRELLDGVRYGPAEARYKVYVIDEVHMLSTAAFNALLKTLEEPPPHAKFIFATTEIRKVPVTILSRCQRFDLRRVEPAVIAANLAQIATAEGFAVDEEALTLIARAAEGSVRDAQSLLDQALVQAEPGESVSAVQVQGMLGLADTHQSIAIFECVAKGDAAGAIKGFRALHAVGADPATVALDLLEHAHAASLAKTLGTGALTLPKDQAARLEALGAAIPASALSRLWQMLLKGHEETRTAPNPAAAVEMLLIRLAYAADLPGPEEALKLLREGAPIPGSSPAPAAPRPGGGARVERPRRAGAGRGPAVRHADRRQRAALAPEFRGGCRVGRRASRHRPQARSREVRPAGELSARRHRIRAGLWRARQPLASPRLEAEGLDRRDLARRAEGRGRRDPGGASGKSPQGGVRRSGRRPFRAGAALGLPGRGSRGGAPGRRRVRDGHRR